MLLGLLNKKVCQLTPVYLVAKKSFLTGKMNEITPVSADTYPPLDSPHVMFAFMPINWGVTPYVCVLY